MTFAASKTSWNTRWQGTCGTFEAGCRPAVLPSSAVWPAAAEERVEDACSRVAAIFNGDPRLPYPVHVRTRATERLSREELVDMAVDGVVRGGLIPSCSSSLPSASRWGSMMACLEGQVGDQRPEDVS